ncbi:MAG: hypothetical protein IK137_02120 [Bacilli bacterium]|nr:hypothetical protein [Bacilli bacterium]
MNEIALKESDVSKLKKYPLHGIWSTESTIYYFKHDSDMNSILIKKLFITDSKRVMRKIDTLEVIKESELSTYKELVLPEDIVVVGGVNAGFTIPEVQNSINLHLFLNDRKIPNRDKIEVLKKIGELLKRVQCSNQEFYFGDLQEYNFLVTKNLEISVVDLDSSSVTRRKPLETKYIILDKKTHGISKYKVNRATRSYPSISNDNYCYNTMILNFLAGEKIHRLTFEEHFAYINYLADIDIIPREMQEVYINHYTDKYNESVLDYLDSIPLQFERGNYNVYKALQKIKKDI